MTFAVLAAALELVFPVSCLVCRTPGAMLCGQCAPMRPPVRTTVGGRRVWSADRYEGAVRSALLAYKERGRRDLAPVLGHRLAGAIRQAARDSPAALLVPVPSARSAARARGGDHVRRLVRHTGWPSAPALRLARPVRDSAGLAAAARVANLSDAFVAGAPPVPGQLALVVDDIVTTGATLREATRALAGAGWTVVGAAVLAATPLPGDGARRDAAAGRRWP